jgi:hypothetical protein
MWNQASQLSQQIALCFHVTSFVLAPHGNLGALGPGFVSVSNAFASRSMNKYF